MPDADQHRLPARPDLQILLVVLWLLSGVDVEAQFVEPRLCHSVCMCFPTERLVDCSENDGLTGVPINLPQYATMLSVQNARFSTVNNATRLTSANLTGRLQFLEKMKITSSGLMEVESRAFVNMRLNLRELDLSSNRLTLLQPFTFSQLNLSVLRLDHNPELVLGPDSLSELRVWLLSLRGCGLKELVWESWRGVRLVQLDLYNNSLRSLSPQFQHLSHVLPESDERRKRDEVQPVTVDLTLNPLQCSCSWARWYAKSLRVVMAARQRLGFTFIDHGIQCAAPGHLRGQILAYLTETQLGCAKATIREVTLDLQQIQTSRQAQIRCLATSPGHDAPKVRLTSDDPSRFAMSSSNFTASQDNTDLLFTQASLNVSLREIKKSTSIQCSAVGEFNGNGGLSEEGPPDQVVSILLTGLEHLLLLPTPAPEASASPDLLGSDESSSFAYSLEKRFTLLQMICSVVVTFLVTGAALCALYRVLKCHRRVTSSPGHGTVSSSLKSSERHSSRCCQWRLCLRCWARDPWDPRPGYSAVKQTSTMMTPGPVLSNTSALRIATPSSQGMEQEYDVPQGHLVFPSTASPGGGFSTPRKGPRNSASPSSVQGPAATLVPYHLDFRTQERFYCYDTCSSPRFTPEHGPRGHPHMTPLQMRPPPPLLPPPPPPPTTLSHQQWR